MLKVLKKLLKKPSCNPSTIETIDRRTKKDPDPEGYAIKLEVVSKTDSPPDEPDDLKDSVCQKELEEMLEESNQLKTDIENLNETLEAIMLAKALRSASSSRSTVEAFSQRLKNVGNQISEISAECAKSLGSCKDTLCMQWNRTKARMTAIEHEQGVQKAYSSEGSEKKLSSEPREVSSPMEKYLEGAKAVKLMAEEQHKLAEKVLKETKLGATGLLAGSSKKGLGHLVKALQKCMQAAGILPHETSGPAPSRKHR